MTDLPTEVFSLNFYNVHCKQIIFGASVKDCYASFFSSFFINADISSRVRILKGPPFSYEFKTMISNLEWIEFKNVFRSDFVTQEPVQGSMWRNTQEVVQRRPQEPLSTISNNTSTLAWRPKSTTDLHAKTVVIDENTVPRAVDLIEFPRGRPSGVDQDSDEDVVCVPMELRSDRASASSTQSWFQPNLPQAKGTPTTVQVAAALIKSTNEILEETPRSVDFGFVKTRVEQMLGLTPKFWGTSEDDEWFFKGKNIIKLTIVSFHMPVSSPVSENLPTGRLDRANQQPPAQERHMDAPLLHLNNRAAIICHEEPVISPLAHKDRPRPLQSSPLP